MNPKDPQPHSRDHRHNLSLPDSQFTTISGMDVHYTMGGEGQSTLLLLHGSFLNLYSWHKVVGPLKQAYQVVAFDRMVFGLTSRPPAPTPFPDGGEWATNPYAPEGQADMTIALMDRLGIEKAILVGHSTGGTIALLTALRHPARVQGLVLVGAMVYSGYPVSEVPQALRQMNPNILMRGIIGIMIRSMHTTIMHKFYGRDAPPDRETINRYRAMLMWGEWEDAFWQLIRATHRLSLAQQCGTLMLPSLVITGEYDRVVPVVQSEQLAQQLPNARMVVLPRCAHMPHEEQPELFVDAITAYLS